MPFIDRKMLNMDMAECINTLKQKIKEEAAKGQQFKTKILVGHMAIEGSMYSDEVDELSNEIMCPVDMFSDYNFTWHGHVHKPQVMHNKPYVAHVGSMDISDFGETEQEKILIYVNSEFKGKFKELKVPSRPLKRIRETIPKDEDPTKYIINLIKKSDDFENSIVKLEISFEDANAAEIDRQKINEILEKNGVFNIAGFTETRNSLAVNKDKENLINDDILPKQAVKLWAEKFVEDQMQKEMFIEICNDIIEQVEVK
jgi:DNA repair exonuclease SbcCD nuclease subunit